MNWRNQIVIRILLLIAFIMADEPDIKREIKALSTHINVKASSS